MTSFIFSNTQPYYEAPRALNNRSFTEIDKKMSVFASGDKVSAVSSVKYGILGKNGKPFYRWDTVQSAGFFRNRAGRIQPYFCVKSNAVKGWRWLHKGLPWIWAKPTRVFEALASGEDNDEFEVSFYRACKEYLGVSGLYDVYPIAGAYGIHKYDMINPDLRAEMSAKTIEEFTARVFGKSRAGSLVKVLPNADPYYVGLAKSARGIVSDNSLKNVLTNNSLSDEAEESYRGYGTGIRPVLLSLGPVKTLEILNMDIDKERMLRINDYSFLTNTTPEAFYRKMSWNLEDSTRHLDSGLPWV